MQLNLKEIVHSHNFHDNNGRTRFSVVYTNYLYYSRFETTPKSGSSSSLFETIPKSGSSSSLFETISKSGSSSGYIGGIDGFTSKLL